MMTAKKSVDEIDLRKVMRVLWRSRWALLVITAIVVVATAVAVLLLPNQYKATAVLAPTASSSSTGALSQLSGLASLAGITLNSGASDDSQIAMEVMQSWGFIDSFIRAHDLAVPIFAADGWDKDHGALLIDSSLYSSKAKKWVRNPPRGKTVEPSSWELYDEFSKHLSVNQDKTTGLVTVTFEFYSPAFAKDVLEKYVSAINEQMRARKLAESGRNIAYLEEQIAKTSVAELRGVFYTLVEEETKGRMLAEARPEYSFITVSPAMLPEEVSKPRRLLIVAFAVVFGVILAAVAVLVWNEFVTGKSTLAGSH